MFKNVCDYHYEGDCYCDSTTTATTRTTILLLIATTTTLSHKPCWDAVLQSLDLLILVALGQRLQRL